MQIGLFEARAKTLPQLRGASRQELGGMLKHLSVLRVNSQEDVEVTGIVGASPTEHTENRRIAAVYAQAAGSIALNDRPGAARTQVAKM